MKHLNRINQWVQRGKKIREMDLLTGIVVLIACFFVGAALHCHAQKKDLETAGDQFPEQRRRVEIPSDRSPCGEPAGGISAACEVAAEQRYQEITGEELTRFYRPPQGKYNTQNLQMASNLGYKTFFWSLAYVDWIQDQQPTKEAAFDKLLKRIHPGAVVLLHSTSSTNAQILDELLTKWEEMGYHFAPLSELAEKI